MKAEKITINGIAVQVLSLEGHQEINKHASIMVKGYINAEESDKAMRLGIDEEIVVITVEEQEKKQTLFAGPLYSLELEDKGGMFFLELELSSSTIKLSGREKTRSFQGASLTFGQLIEHAGEEDEMRILLEETDKPIQTLVVQYKENNWDFILRMASNLNACVIPQVQSLRGQCAIGLIKSMGAVAVQSSEIVKKNELFMVREKTGLGITMYAQDGISYEFKDREIYALGDKVEIKGEILYIAQIDSYYEGQELCHTYTARTEKNFEMPKLQNNKIIGASLMGKVSSVAGTTVKIILDVDRQNAICGSRMFPFSTVYSSPNGTGWYCMPEIGDTVRLYFPTEFEKDAYVISSVHVDAADVSAEQTPRTDPAYKSISNIQNKEIILGPSGITITNNAGMVVTLDDETGLTIDSNLPIHINSDEYVEINAEQSVYLHSCGEFKLEQGEGNYLDMDEGVITLSGDEFRMQEK